MQKLAVLLFRIVAERVWLVMCRSRRTDACVRVTSEVWPSRGDYFDFSCVLAAAPPG